MRVDYDTLRDLDVLAAPGRGLGLLDRLDRTRTRGGREALRHRLTKPLASRAEIEAVQDTLRYIEANRTSFNDLPDEAEIAPLARYLDSRFATISSTSTLGTLIESVAIRVRHADLYAEAVAGMRRVAAFLSELDKLALAHVDAPRPLADRLHDVRTTIGTDMLPWLMRRGRFAGWRDTLLRDRTAREDSRTVLRQLIACVHEIDALVAMSDVTVEKSFAYPEIQDEGVSLELEAVWHPFLDAPVANDARLAHGRRLAFVTGPNMAGKTTYLKACGVAVLLAHTGMGVPAARCRLAVLDRLVTALRTEDDLAAGVSYFQAEARRVRQLAEPLARGEHCLVIVDELFRGTNVMDAYDATLAVLRAFSAATTGLFVIASHLIEVANELERTSGVVLTRFDAHVVEDSVTFDYAARSGVSDQRLGMRVLEREGVLRVLDAIRGLGTDVSANGT